MNPQHTRPNGEVAPTRLSQKVRIGLAIAAAAVVLEAPVIADKTNLVDCNRSSLVNVFVCPASEKVGAVHSWVGKKAVASLSLIANNWVPQQPVYDYNQRSGN